VCADSLGEKKNLGRRRVEAIEGPPHFFRGVRKEGKRHRQALCLLILFAPNASFLLCPRQSFDRALLLSSRDEKQGRTASERARKRKEKLQCSGKTPA
jgi:hypothetical protein